MDAVIVANRNEKTKHWRGSYEAQCRCSLESIEVTQQIERRPVIRQFPVPEFGGLNEDR